MRVQELEGIPFQFIFCLFFFLLLRLFSYLSRLETFYLGLLNINGGQFSRVARHVSDLLLHEVFHAKTGGKRVHLAIGCAIEEAPFVLDVKLCVELLLTPL